MASKRTPSGHRARKRFGQNFLVDETIIASIVRAVSPKADDIVVEIGPGQGALTGPLLTFNPNLHVVELDRDLIPVLLAQFANYRGFKIHQCDALTFDFSSLAAPNKKLRVVGNLPYNISTALIFRLCDVKQCISDMHFMLQKEVVNRVTAEPGDKNYGRLSIMVQYHCATECLLDVPPECFEPAPKVNSAVARFTPHQHLPHQAKNLANFDRFVKSAFSQRRKTLRNALKPIVNDKMAENVGLDLSRRAERISLAEYVRLSNDLWGTTPLQEL